MGTRPISRTEHLVPGSSAPRPGPASHAEDQTDLVQHLRSLEQAHAGALHGTGVASGLTVHAAGGAGTVRVAPGVAVDRAGRHVVLAPGGRAELATDPDEESRLVSVTELGVEVPLAGHRGQCRLALRWRETFDQEVWEDTEDEDERVFLTHQTPWLCLTSATGAPADDDVVLATLSVTDDGQVATEGVAPGDRSGPTVGATELELRATGASSPAGGETVVSERAGAVLRTDLDGGFTVRQAGNTTPGLALTAGGDLTVGGAAAVTGALRVGNRAAVDGQLTVGGEAAVTGALRVGNRAAVDGPLTVGGDAAVTGALRVGNRAAVDGPLTVGGDVTVTGALRGRNGAVLDGSLRARSVAAGASAAVGGPQDAGRIDLHDPTGRTGLTATSNGGSGGVWVRNAGTDAVVLEGATGRVYVNGPEWRQLGGNAARYMQSVWLSADAGTSLADVDLGARRQFTAFVATCGNDPRNPYDRSHAIALDIFRVDGARTATSFFGGDHWGAQGLDSNVLARTFWGQGRVITFRARSFAAASVLGIGVVFYE